jgi:hypothetical protein
VRRKRRESDVPTLGTKCRRMMAGAPFVVTSGVSATVDDDGYLPRAAQPWGHRCEDWRDRVEEAAEVRLSRDDVNSRVQCVRVGTHMRKDPVLGSDVVHGGRDRPRPRRHGQRIDAGSMNRVGRSDPSIAAASATASLLSSIIC